MKHLKLFAALCCAAMLFAACDKSNEPSNGANNQNIENGREYVDLGLPSGTLWATCNVGANSPEEYGDYFAWGETETKITYSWSTYKYGSAHNALIKYCNDASYGKDGFTDYQTVLDPEDDAAAANWGGKWRMPTDVECTELCKNCTWTWTTLNGVNGCKVMSKTNGNSIFLPAEGCRRHDDLDNVGLYGGYWLSSLAPVDPYCALYMYFGPDGWGRNISGRYYGFSVRPVFK